MQRQNRNVTPGGTITFKLYASSDTGHTNALDTETATVTGNTSSLCGVFRRTRQGQPSARGTLAAE